MSRGICLKILIGKEVNISMIVDIWRDDIVRLCDINECSDCPRYGDDCDGREDDDAETE